MAFPPQSTSSHQGHGSSSGSEAPDDDLRALNIFFADGDDETRQCRGIIGDDSTSSSSSSSRCENRIDAHAWKAERVRFCHLHADQAAAARARFFAALNRTVARQHRQLDNFIDDLWRMRKADDDAFRELRARVAAAESTAARLRCERDEADARCARVERRLAASEREKAELVRENEELASRNAELASRNAELAREKAEGDRTREELEVEASELLRGEQERSARALQEAAERAGATEKTHSAVVEGLEGELRDARETNASLTANLKACQDRAEAREAELEADNGRLSARLGGAERQLRAVRERNETLAAELESAKGSTEDVKAELSQKTADYERLDARLGHTETALADARRRNTTLGAELEDSRDNVEALEADVGRLTTRVSDAERELRNARRRHMTMPAEFDDTQDSADALDVEFSRMAM